MKKTFFAGLVILLPIVVTFFIIFFIVDFVTGPFVGIVEELIIEYGTPELAEQKHFLLLFISRITVLVLFCFLILALGVLGRKIFFSWIIHLTDRIFYKIPIIKTIYKASREISNSFLRKKSEKLFQGTVTVPFPNQNSRALGLLAGIPPKQVSDQKKDLEVVFIPTAPHPISGFLLMFNQDDVKRTDIETEDLFKFLVSCGSYRPWEKPTK